MAESKVKDENFFLVSGWMVNRLGLKGTALHLFAIIYGFSQDGEGSFSGSLQYLCDFTNATKKTVITALKDLTEKGYLTKTESFINGLKFNTYKITPGVEKLHLGGEEITPGVVKNLHRGGEEITPNNKEDNKSLIDKEIVKKVIDLYHEICVSYPKIRAVSKGRGKAILALRDNYSMEDLKTVFENAESSSFLKGNNDRKWRATFDWMITEGNFVKILEGNYADKGRKEMVPGWMERQFDDDEVRAIQAMMADDDLTERAERLRMELQGGV
jgi:hypothetical protein